MNTWDCNRQDKEDNNPYADHWNWCIQVFTKQLRNTRLKSIQLVLYEKNGGNMSFISEKIWIRGPVRDPYPGTGNLVWHYTDLSSAGPTTHLRAASNFDCESDQGPLLCIYRSKCNCTPCIQSSLSSTHERHALHTLRTWIICWMLWSGPMGRGLGWWRAKSGFLLCPMVDQSKSMSPLVPLQKEEGLCPQYRNKPWPSYTDGSWAPKCHPHACTSQIVLSQVPILDLWGPMESRNRTRFRKPAIRKVCAASAINSLKRKTCVVHELPKSNGIKLGYWPLSEVYVPCSRACGV
jgi:hypothetical protein